MTLNPRNTIEFFNPQDSGRQFWPDGTVTTETRAPKWFENEVLERYRAGNEIEQRRSNLRMTQKQVEEYQLQIIKRLVKCAWEQTTFYREKYTEAGITQQDIDNFTWETYRKLPAVTKLELIQAFPEKCVLEELDPEKLFPTSSTGSTGLRIKLVNDEDAIATDTWDWIRQMELQTLGRFTKDDSVALLYTEPWWINDFNGDYKQNFISSLLPPVKQAAALDQFPPTVISTYPSILLKLIPHLSVHSKSKLRAVVIHSEQSTEAERLEMARLLGVPVLDEYSSEELKRIALQLPDRKYYLCEDAVRLDVLDPVTKELSPHGTGVATATDLTNFAMPFIKYVQGDMVAIEYPKLQTSSVGLQWRQLKKLEGRLNDAFLLADGTEISSGTLLDLTYNAMPDLLSNIQEFELIQTSHASVEINLVAPELHGSHEEQLEASNRFRELIERVLGKNVVCSVHFKKDIPKFGIKRRPIRRTFNH